ncbi:MAG TPA: stage III sporulation protein SpoIIIAB [Cerasibacillus sp.]|uniref:stage III sporulation protein SpoIIIAB n=1 Tax=Cerasibacillus sp. TaxID=2498711 RepID=UPI002F41BF86
MKWFGAILIIIATTLIGFEWSHRLSGRPKHIRQLKHALQILEGEMLYSQLPLQEAFNVISKRMPYPVNYLFETLVKQMNESDAHFPEVWRKSVRLFLSRSHLGNNEAEILYQFGRSIGQHDLTQQQKHIYLTMTHLDRELEEARDQHIKFSQMAKSLGFLLGVFIVLILI